MTIQRWRIRLALVLVTLFGCAIGAADGWDSLPLMAAIGGSWLLLRGDRP